MRSCPECGCDVVAPSVARLQVVSESGCLAPIATVKCGDCGHEFPWDEQWREHHALRAEARTLPPPA